MDTLTMREKLIEYIEIADDDKVEAMYDAIKDEVAQRYEWWNDEKMVAELERRSADLKSGKVQGVAWEDVKARLLSRAHQK